MKKTLALLLWRPRQGADFRTVVLGEGGGSVASPSYDVRYGLLYAGTEDEASMP